MSKYTTEVRFICETESGLSESVGFDDVENVIKNARSKIFSFYYPIFDEAYRETLETKILRHYYTREIGLETYGLWKLKLNSKLNDIMPYYNQLYESAKLEFNPFYDVDYKKTHTGNYDKKHDVTNNGTSKSVDRFSDTPQGSLQNIENNTYLTTADIVDGTATNNDKGTEDGRDKYTDVYNGKMGTKSYSKMLEEYRETFLNIDMQIIDELKDLFMLLW